MSTATNYRSDAGYREVMNLYDRILKASPVPAEESRVDTRHGATFVLSCGNPASPPLVMLHDRLPIISDAELRRVTCRCCCLVGPGRPARHS
jgi:hypothetical protein